MKKIIVIVTCFVAFLFAGCGVGSYSVSSGQADEGYVTFVASSAYDITVDIDGQTYKCKTVKEIPHKTRRDIKKTAQNTITVKPGTHTLKVSAGGQEKLSQKIFISAQETKIIKL